MNRKRFSEPQWKILRMVVYCDTKGAPYTTRRRASRTVKVLERDKLVKATYNKDFISIKATAKIRKIFKKL